MIRNLILKWLGLQAAHAALAMQAHNLTVVAEAHNELERRLLILETFLASQHDRLPGEKVH
jgi:hypothetical protein